MNPSKHFDAIASAVAGKPQSDFEATALRLRTSPQERRLFEHLRNHGEASTIQIRQTLGIGNVSSAAMFFNRKAEAADEPWRIICEVRPISNRFSERTTLGYWHLVDMTEGETAA